MASPAAVGVAALIVSRYGVRDRRGWPDAAARSRRAILSGTATKMACPTPPDFTYTRHLPTGQTVTSTQTCEGGFANNGFYGKGIVDALSAVTPCSTTDGARERSFLGAKIAPRTTARRLLPADGVRAIDRSGLRVGRYGWLAGWRAGGLFH